MTSRAFLVSGTTSGNHLSSYQAQRLLTCVRACVCVRVCACVCVCIAYTQHRMRIRIIAYSNLSSSIILLFALAAESQTLPCQQKNGTACPPVVCPNDTIRFECTAQKTPDERTYWTLSVSYVGGYCKDFVYVGQTAPLGSSICTDSTWILDCESLLGLPIVNFNVTDTPPDTNGTCLGSELTLCLSSDYIITGVKAICANTSVPFEGIPYLSYGETSINVTSELQHWYKH